MSYTVYYRPFVICIQGLVIKKISKTNPELNLLSKRGHEGKKKMNSTMDHFK